MIQRQAVLLLELQPFFVGVFLEESHLLLPAWLETAL